ncbi:MAG: DUF2156 domain-containing protein [Firmicutes bacterium]|nr:DUF2156 domain-containing protein [Bacillota bacterium]
MIFKRDFNNLTEEEVSLLTSYFEGYDYNSSGHTFIANYIWRNTHNITWEVIEGYLFLAGLGTTETEEETYFMSFPLTKDGQYDPPTIKTAIEKARIRFKEAGKKFEFGLVPENLLWVLEESYGDEIEIEHTPDDDDYIYLKEDLVKLSGRKYHQKKNHLNYFKRTYKYEYQEITKDMVEEIRNFIGEINEDKHEETHEDWQEILRLETVAIDELLKFVNKGLVGGVIRIDGKIEAVTIGEFERSDSKKTVIVHVEKANPEYRGIYQAINNEFCLRLPEETVYVNREEDMGMENLRQTKLSYRPFVMGRKYTANFKE